MIDRTWKAYEQCSHAENLGQMKSDFHNAAHASCAWVNALGSDVESRNFSNQKKSNRMGGTKLIMRTTNSHQFCSPLILSQLLVRDERLNIMLRSGKPPVQVLLNDSVPDDTISIGYFAWKSFWNHWPCMSFVSKQKGISFHADIHMCVQRYNSHPKNDQSLYSSQDKTCHVVMVDCSRKYQIHFLYIFPARFFYRMVLFIYLISLL